MEIIVPVGILVLAFFYSSVGHGGASGYLAIMAIFGFEPNLLRSSALILNILVAGIAFAQYYRKGWFKWKLFLPFALSSIPMAFVGGMLDVDPRIYKIVLGACLIIAVLRMIGLLGKNRNAERPIPVVVAIGIGAALGLVSGMIGIGGGILLSPIILLLHWASMKETAAVSALFILVNSIAGLIGISTAGTLYVSEQIYIWVIVAVVGGALGSYLGSNKISNKALTYLLATVLAFASYKLLFL